MGFLESDFDSDIKSLMKMKSHMQQQNNIKIQPTPVKNDANLSNSIDNVSLSL